MLTSILVANRGEIAARIIRTIHDLGLRAVAIYTPADLDSPAVDLADAAYSVDSYTQAEQIIAIAQRSGADAVHPGYGFLSEDPAFATAVHEAGLTWIGPPPSAITQLGDKISARRTAEKAGVAPVPGREIATAADVRDFARNGFPIVAKKADGGGGRGISILRDEADLAAFEARYPDLSGIFVEKFVTGRHIETQCMADQHGNFAVVSTRDCSVQRRNQKLIEEAPALLEPHIEDTIREWSRALFEESGYVGLGTCEFIVGEEPYFLEVNPRLQVEHTVTEEITGMDLVQQQIAIAAGEQLTHPPHPRGHSLELRITSEDHTLTPSSGTITHLTWPAGHGVRIETGVRHGDSVSADFDSMIAKLIITGPTRHAAIARARRALHETAIEGVPNAIPLIKGILNSEFAAGPVHARWLEEEFLPGYEAPPSTTSHTEKQGRRSVVVEIDGQRHTMTMPADLFGQQPSQPRRTVTRSGLQTQATGEVVSPMQAMVVRVPVTAGQTVQEGELLVVLEAMKMEKYIHATLPGTISEVHVAEGNNVAAGAALVTIQPAEPTKE
ncbi:MAG TPA: ATP-grasp domain-containing protein, partial [Candidatus Corynebacterium gallistercoris]|nr:ATP-grasp domain-containing protein [Candidatus Corynebacterium gallistercoris]